MEGHPITQVQGSGNTGATHTGLRFTEEDAQGEPLPTGQAHRLTDLGKAEEAGEGAKIKGGKGGEKG